MGSSTSHQIRIPLPESKTFIIHRKWLTDARKSEGRQFIWLTFLTFIRVVGVGLTACWFMLGNIIFVMIAVAPLYTAATMGHSWMVALWYGLMLIWFLLNLNDHLGDIVSRRFIRIEGDTLLLKKHINQSLSSWQAKKLIDFALSRSKKPQPWEGAVYALNKAAIIVFSTYAMQDWSSEFSASEYLSSMVSVAVLAFDGLSLGALDTLGIPLPEGGNFFERSALYLTKALLGFGVIASAVIIMTRTLSEREVYVGTEYNLRKYFSRYHVSTGNEYRLLLCGPDPEKASEDSLEQISMEELDDIVNKQIANIEKALCE